MEVGVSKYWTPEAEGYYSKILAGCNTFAQRHLVMLIRDILKYDGRSKLAKRAIAQARLRLATATNNDLEELVSLEIQMEEEGSLSFVPGRLTSYKQLQAHIRERGIKRSELECP